MPDIPAIPAPSAALNGSQSYSYVTTDALQIAAVTACVGLRAGTLAQLPIRGYYDVDGVSKQLTVQPELLVAPSSTVVPSIWKTQMSISRDIWGYAVGPILAVDGAGYPSKVDWFPPDTVRAWQDFVGGPIRWSIAGQEIDASLMFHVPSRWVMPGKPLGFSPLEYSGLVDLAKRCQDFGRDWFAKGCVPSAILYSDTVLDSKQADDLLGRITSRWRNRQPAVLGSGLKYEKVSVAPNESQFLETATRVAADIAISFNIAPERIGAAIAGQSITYANRDQQVQQGLVDAVNPELVVVQESITRHMAPGTYAGFATGAFLRSDLKTRYEAASIGIEAQFIHPDEARAWEDLPPLTPEQVATMPTGKASVAETVQKVYLGVTAGLITVEEGRLIINAAGGQLPAGVPTELQPSGGST